MIYFVRHGESEANAKKVFAGSNYPAQLTEKGRAQAKLAGEKIIADDLIIDRIICSTMQRAVDTANIIASVIAFDKNEIIYNSDLIEYDIGELSGKQIEGVSSYEKVTARGAEDPYEFQKRVMTCLQNIRLFSGNTLVVCHAGIGRIFETTKKGISPMSLYDTEPYPNAQVIKLDW